MSQKITYQATPEGVDVIKQNLTAISDREHQITAEDLNEIAKVVNHNADETDANTEAIATLSDVFSAQLLQLLNPDLVMQGYVNPESDEPAGPSENDAYIVSAAGSIFGSLSCNLGDVVYWDGSDWIVDSFDSISTTIQTLNTEMETKVDSTSVEVINEPITQAEYDAIPEKNPTTLYLIKSA